MALSKLIFGLLLLAVAVAADRNELLREAVAAIKPELSGILNLGDINLTWSKSHWLFFHQNVNLTCRWGSVYPLEQLALAAPAKELQPSSAGTRKLSGLLGCSRLSFRYDNCVFLVDTDMQEMAVRGDLSDSEFDVEVTLSPNQSKCHVTINKLSLEEPKFNLGNDSIVVRLAEENGYLEDVKNAIRSQINQKVSDELKKFVGKKYNINKEC